MPMRYDRQPLQAVIKTDEGFIIDEPILSRTGIFVYLNADGSIRKEYRPPEEVFNKDSMQSLLGKPITVEHPDGLVTYENVNYLAIGTVLSEGRQDGDNLKGKIVIHQPNQMGSRRELSLGYSLDLIETPGEINGERYDAIQRNIRYNHLSVVKSGRAGVARLNMDNCQIFDNHPETEKMPKIRLDNGIEYEAPQEVIAVVDSLRKDNAELLAKNEKTEAERDALKAQTAAHASELEKARNDGFEQANARFKLEAVAASFNVDCKGKTDNEIKIAVIKTNHADADLTGKSDAYIQARFDIACEAVDSKAMQEQRKAGINKDSKDEQPKVLTSAERRDAMINDFGKASNAN